MERHEWALDRGQLRLVVHERVLDGLLERHRLPLGIGESTLNQPPRRLPHRPPQWYDEVAKTRTPSLHCSRTYLHAADLISPLPPDRSTQPPLRELEAIGGWEAPGVTEPIPS